jgi:hypothetical protein
MNELLFSDIVRFGHLLAVAVGLGAAVMADLVLLGRITGRIDAETVRNLVRAHRVIGVALLAMWCSGAILIWLRTGFDPAQVSPKLLSKLVVVTLLTTNAMVIGRLALPLIESYAGRSLMWLPTPDKMLLAAIASVSSISWLLALAFGASKILAAAGWPVFVLLLPTAYGLAIAGGIGVMLICQLRFDSAPLRLRLDR